MAERSLTPRQKDVLFCVGQSAPASVARLAYDLPMFSRAAIRAHLDRLERRGLLDRQYSGRSDIGYLLSTRGREALAALNLDDDYDPAEQAGGDRG